MAVIEQSLIYDSREGVAFGVNDGQSVTKSFGGVGGEGGYFRWM